MPVINDDATTTELPSPYPVRPKEIEKHFQILDRYIQTVFVTKEQADISLHAIWCYTKTLEDKLEGR